jgi:hypothetical protein
VERRQRHGHKTSGELLARHAQRYHGAQDRLRRSRTVNAVPQGPRTTFGFVERPHRHPPSAPDRADRVPEERREPCG